MLNRSLVAFLTVAVAFATQSLAAEPQQPTLTTQNSGTSNGLIAVSPVNPRVVWASGRGGTFTVTTDGGDTWKAGVVPGAEALQFRDVEGVSGSVAYLLSIGNGTDSRIYKTVDGGSTWTMQFQSQNPDAFYDCFAFWTRKRGIAHSDSVNGVFPDLRTTDGMTWQDNNNLPPALPGEASFSSSGTCVATQGERNAWIATGGSTIARILATRDGGDTWHAYATPLVSSPSAGAFTVAFRDPWHGVVGGGDLDPKDPNNAATATSSDGGKTWKLTNRPPVTGAIFGLAYTHGIGDDGQQTGEHEGGRDAEQGAPEGSRDREQGEHEHGRAVVVTAPGGAAWTPDEGNTWHTLPGVTGYWAVAFASPKAGWLVGTEGRILKISF
jgi:photosystem II stability/assembly factor-like uncharacterized protein